MAKGLISDAAILTLKLSAQVDEKERPQWLWDTKIQGLGVRATAAGKAFYYFQWWSGGREKGSAKRLPLGEHGDASSGKLTVAAARKRALIERGKVEAGGDPARDRKFTRAKLTADTLADAWGQFTASWPDDDRFRRETKALIANDVLPAIGDVPFASIKRAYLASVIDRVTARSQARGRAAFNALRLLFKWAVERELIEHSPLEGLRAPKAVAARKRVLDGQELAAFWTATDLLNQPWRDAYRLLTITCCRRQEIGAMRWAELDGGTWTIPGDRTKNEEEHVIDLPPLAMTILDSISRRFDLVFTTTGTTPISGWGKPKKQLDRHMTDILGKPVKPWVSHDLRRTARTTLAEDLDIDSDTCERLLNHKVQGIRAVYDRSTLRRKRREALRQWADHLQTNAAHWRLLN